MYDRDTASFKSSALLSDGAFGIATFPPPPVGALQITSSFSIPVTVKPARFHLWMMRKMFGWKWFDYKKEQS